MRATAAYRLLRIAPSTLSRSTQHVILPTFQPSHNLCRTFTSTPCHRFTSTPPTAESASRSPNPTSPTTTRNSLAEFSLNDHVTLVSGGARGLGLTMCSALLEAGSTVYALDRLPDPAPEFSVLQQTHSSDTQEKTKLHYRQIDVRDVEALNATVGEIANGEGRIDGLIAAAGIQQETPALEYAAEDARRMMDVNVVGAMMTAQAVARQMVRLQTGGSIAFVASMSGTVANRGLFCPAYNASKAAVIQLARNLAAEWGQHGIRCNTLSPGYIVTAMTAELFKTFPERRDEWASQNMLGRLSKPEEFRGAAVFLMSGASSFMTGSDLRIDGGHCAW